MGVALTLAIVMCIIVDNNAKGNNNNSNKAEVKVVVAGIFFDTFDSFCGTSIYFF